MSNQLDLMFDLLQQEVEEFTADLAREDSGDLLHSKLDTISKTGSPLKLDIDFYSMEAELDRSLKKKHSSNSIAGSNNNNRSTSPLQPPTNFHQRSASHNDVDTILHQKSNSADSQSESRDSDYLSPVSPPSALSDYQRIISLSDSALPLLSPMVSPIISPILSPRMVSKTALILSSDSDSDVSVSSSDDTSESDDSDDSDDSPLMIASSNLLRKKSLTALANAQNSSVNGQKSIVSNENNSTTSLSQLSLSTSTSTGDSSINTKKIQRTPTTGRGLNKSPISSSRNETSTNLPLHKDGVNRSKSYDTDDENRPLRPRANSIGPRRVQESKKVNGTITNSNDTDDKNRPLRPRANSIGPRRVQESKKVNGTITNSNDTDDKNRPLRPRANSIGPRRVQESKKVNRTITNSNDTDDKNRPLRSRANSRAQDTNLEKQREEKQIARSRANSRAQESSDIQKDSPVRTHRIRESIDQISRRSSSKERISDDKLFRSKEHTERGRDRSRSREQENGERERQIHSRDHSRGRAKSRVRVAENESRRDRARDPLHDGDSEKVLERRTSRNELINEAKARAKSRTREPEDREQMRSRNKEVEKLPDKERMNARENLEERGRGSNRNTEQDNDRGQEKSKVRGEEERGRAKSKVRGEEERGREVREGEREIAKSKTREEERGRTKSSPKEREVEERSGRAKSRTRENDNRERAKSRARREKAETLVEKEEKKITEIKLTAQIFIEDVRQFRTLSITSTRTALDILSYFRNYNTISNDETWTLFEVINEYGLERPIRDWEYVATVIGTWELNKPNALVLKKYLNRSCLTLDGFNNAVPPMFGWLHLEVKKNKWQKRHFYIKDGAVYHCKDVKGNNETLLCSLTNFDVYTFTKTVKKSPTKFVFALKSQDKFAMFEKPDDYIRYLCTDHLDKMKDWVLSLRAAKNTLIRAENPERFIEKPIEREKTSVSDNHDKLHSSTDLEKSQIGENSTELNAHNEEKRRSNRQWENIRRYVRNSGSSYDKSDNLLGPISNSSTRLKKQSSSGLKESSNNTIAASGNQPFKEGSLLDFNEKNPPPKQVEPEVATYATGSLLALNDTLFDQAKEREKLRKAMGGVGIIRDPNSSTFVNLDNSVKFNQGSLLDRNNDTRTEHNNNFNNSGRLVQIEDGVQFNKGSLLTKHKESTPIGHLAPIEDGVQFNKGSLLTKVQESNEKNNNTLRLRKSPSETLLKIDAPLSRSATIQKISSPNGKTLLELDLKPDAAHTLALRNTNIKPLLSFVPGERDNNLEGAKSPRNLLGNNKMESETDSEYDSDK